MALHVPPPRLNEIVLGRRGITADTALGERLEREIRPISLEQQTDEED